MPSFALCPLSPVYEQRKTELVLSLVEGNYELVAMLSYLAQSNKMLKYKKAKFLFIFAKKRALLITFVKFLTNSYSFLPIF